MGEFLKTRLVSEFEWLFAHAKTGSLYFIRNDANDSIKIGHTRDLNQRLTTLQIGNDHRLQFIGIIAAPIEVEPIVHFKFCDGHIRGEWFWDRGVLSEWLLDMTQGEPLRRHIWEIVPGREVYWNWHEGTRTHSKHVWDRQLNAWQPSIA